MPTTLTNNPASTAVSNRSEEVLEALRGKREMIHVVLTGRGAKDELIELADLVTEMKMVKHPYRAGIKAQKGVEF